MLPTLILLWLRECVLNVKHDFNMKYNQFDGRSSIRFKTHFGDFEMTFAAHGFHAVVSD